MHLESVGESRGSEDLMAYPAAVISDRWVLIGLLILALPGVLFIGLAVYSWFRSSSSNRRDDDSMEGP